MHRSVAATVGVVALLLGIFSFQPKVAVAGIAVGLLFLGIAITGQPGPRWPLPVEALVTAGGVGVTVLVIASVAYVLD